MANELERITLDPKIMGGKATIRDTRVTVGAILGLLSIGYSTQQILQEYPYLEAEDVPAALKYASLRMSEESELPFKTA